MTSVPHRIRKMKSGEDANFIADSWLRSYLDMGRHISWVPMQMYYERMRPLVTALLHNHPEMFRIACPPDNDEPLLGWACVEDTGEKCTMITGKNFQLGHIECGDSTIKSLHYLYVKKKWRGNGIARSLLKDVPRPVPCSHWTHHCERRNGDLTFKPSLFYRRREKERK
jgi:GNAT superfamily N-acetyltransferase